MFHSDAPSSVSKQKKSSHLFWQQAILFCFHLLLLVVPLFFTWFNDELFEFNKMILTYGITILIGTFWACRMIAEKRIFVRRSVFDLPILLFLVSQIAATIFSIDIHTSIFGYYTRFNGGLLSFFCYAFLFYAFISNVEKRDVPRLFFTTFVSATIVSLWAIPEHFGHSMSCLMINLYRYRGQPLPSGWFGQFYDDSCWIQDVQSRVFATFGQPNWLAAYAILLIPVGMVLSISERLVVRVFKSTTITRIFYFVCTTLLLLSLLFTKSRSGVLGLVIGLAVFAAGVITVWFLHFRQQSLTSPSAQKWWQRAIITGSLFVGAFVLSVLIFGTPITRGYGEDWFNQAFSHKATTVQTAPPPPADGSVSSLDIGGTDSGEIRRIVWTGAIRVWLRYPLFGSGVETFAYSYYKDRPMEHNLVSEWDFLYNKAHNEFLNFLATTGIFGFLTYTLMLCMFTAYPVWFVLKKSLFKPKDLTSQPVETLTLEAILFAFAIASGLVALSVSNFFGFSTVMVNILLFLAPGFFVIEYFPLEMNAWSFADERGETSDSSEGPDEDSSLVSGISYVIVFCIEAALLFSVYSLWRADFVYNLGKQYIQANDANHGLEYLQEAIEISPNEPTFYDDLASAYSRVALALAQQGDATNSAQFARQAIDTSNQMLALSPANLNLYKTQARVYMNLSELDPNLLMNAKSTIQKAIDRAPTDPKLRYFLALIEVASGDTSNGIADLQKTIQMKPDYEPAYLSLGEAYEAAGQKDQAKAEYEYILQKIQPDDLEAQQHLASLSAQLAPSKLPAKPSTAQKK